MIAQCTCCEHFLFLHLKEHLRLAFWIQILTEGDLPDDPSYQSGYVRCCVRTAKGIHRRDTRPGHDRCIKSETKRFKYPPPPMKIFSMSEETKLNF